MHSMLILSSVLSLTSAAILPLAARTQNGKEIFKRESEPMCWSVKTMSPEMAEKVLCALKEKAKADEECCVAGKGVDVTCAMAPAEAKSSEGEHSKSYGGEGKEKRWEEESKVMNAVYINTDAEGQEGKCVKSEILVQHLEEVIKQCTCEEKKSAEKRGEGESMKSEWEAKKMVAGKQDIVECEGLYISLHSGPAEGKEGGENKGGE